MWRYVLVLCLETISSSWSVISFPCVLMHVYVLGLCVIYNAGSEKRELAESQWSRNQWYFQLLIYGCTKLWDYILLGEKLISDRSGGAGREEGLGCYEMFGQIETLAA